jgi:hypothetical protein
MNQCVKSHLLGKVTGESIAYGLARGPYKIQTQEASALSGFAFFWFGVGGMSPVETREEMNRRGCLP